MFEPTLSAPPQEVEPDEDDVEGEPDDDEVLLPLLLLVPSLFSSREICRSLRRNSRSAARFSRSRFLLRSCRRAISAASCELSPQPLTTATTSVSITAMPNSLKAPIAKKIQRVQGPSKLRQRLFLLLLLVTGGLIGCGAGEQAQTAQQQPGTATVTSKSQPIISAADRRSFRRLLNRLGADGALAVADLSGDEPQRINSLRDSYGWSTIKTVIVAQLLKDVGSPNGLSAAERAQAKSAITRSDNGAARSLYSALEARHGGNVGAAKAMTSLLHKAGDHKTVVSTKARGSFSAYGQTRWQPTAQARFISALARGCLLSRASKNFLLALMRSVIAEQRWGIGSLSGDLPFKGGWGPDPGGQYLVRQVGVLKSSNGNQFALAVALRSNDGSFESGAHQLTRIAKWASVHLGDAQSRTAC